MDPESIGKETIIKVTDWLRGMWEMKRRTSPVQQWVNSIPSPINSNIPISVDVKLNSSAEPTLAKDIPHSKGNRSKIPTMTVSAPINVPGSPAINMARIPSSLPHGRLARDQSFQSDSSHCSSVESLLELRKADPEAILLSLGFGGCSNSPQEIGPLSRIPKRFLQPSKLKGIAINDFVKKQQETSESFDSVSLGYRGLTGSPYVAPSEIVQKIMERLREHESQEMDAYTVYNSYEQYNKMYPQTRQSVLSSDNRQFLEQPRSRSPDMRNKRMIIGQKSFAFGYNGDLIEICLPNTKKSDENTDSYCNTDDISAPKELKDMQIKSEIMSTHSNELDEIVERKLSDQFNDSVDSSETDELLMQTCKCSKSNIEEDEQTEPIVTIAQNDDHILSKCTNVRRSSEAFEIKLKESNITQDGRRFSDSMITEEQINGNLLLRRRRSLKRQFGVDEFDKINFYDSNPAVAEILHNKKTESTLSSDIHEIREQTTDIKELTLCKLNDSTYSLESTNEVECLSAQTPNESYGPSNNSKCLQNTSTNTSKISSTTTLLEKKDNCKKKNQVCCCKEKIECIYKAEEIDADCCCQFDDSKCWEKVEKIMQENKKLEDIVAKSRIEMAEIRDMLNSVLSVRMEPGF